LIIAVIGINGPPGDGVWRMHAKLDVILDWTEDMENAEERTYRRIEVWLEPSASLGGELMGFGSMLL
jgi:hypothetical protein